MKNNNRGAMEIIQIVATILTVGISIVALVKSISVSNTQNAMQQKINSMQYRPQLLIEETPELLDVTISNVKQEDKNFFLTISLRFKLKYTNKSETKANIVGIHTWNTVSKTDDIRKLLLDKKEEIKVDTFIIDELQMIPITEIPAQETREVEFDIKVDVLDSNKLIFHYLLLYTNDFNILYDSYYWFEYEIPQGINVELIFKPSNEQLTQLMEDNLKQKIKFLNKNYSSIIYSEEEQSLVLEKRNKGF